MYIWIYHPQGSTTVVLTVTNLDDNAASITLEAGSSTITLAEDNALGSTIVRVKATDSDTGIAFTYTIDSGQLETAFFTLKSMRDTKIEITN